MLDKFKTSLSNSSTLLLVVLIAAGFAGNYFSYPFGFGVDFLFGSIAVLMAVVLYGMNWGILASSIASLYTIVLWQHPYALIIFICEAAFVGWRVGKRNKRLLTSDMIFWLSIGMPLVLLFYGLVLQAGNVTTAIILFKQPVNGIFNALIASLLLNFKPFHRWANSSTKQAKVYFEQILLNLMVAFVLIPALMLMVVSNKVTLNHEQDRLITTLESSAQNLATDLQRWHKSGIRALSYLAKTSSQTEIVVSGQTQNSLELAADSLPLFKDIYYINADRQVIASSNLQISNSDWADFPDLDLPRKPQIFVLPNQTSNKPKILQTLPIILDGRWLGNIIAELNIDFIRYLLEVQNNSVPLQSTLVDENRLLIASTDKEVVAKNKFERPKGEITEIETTDSQQEVYHWLPIIEGKPLIARWRESVYGKNLLIDEEEIPLFLCMEAPVAPYIDYLQLFYIRSLAILFFIALFSIAIARFLSRLLVKPILNLAIFTTNLPQKILRNETIELPRSSIIEMNALAQNFEVMSSTVEENIQQIKHTNKKLKSAKGKLEVANKAKDKFIANISHELKTPLNSMIGYSNLIKKELNLNLDREHSNDSNQSKSSEWLDNILQSGRYLVTLIDEILDLAKSQASKINLHPSLIETSKLIDDVSTITRLNAAEKGISFKVKTSKTLPTNIYADEQRLKQILLNLLDNGVKFSDQGEITWEIEQLNRTHNSDASFPSQVHLRFAIIDTGIGIPWEDIPRVFKPFEQINKYEFKKSSGKGLGLSISKELVELMGGKIEVNSEPDRGSKFWFDLAFPEIKLTTTVEQQSLEEIVGYKGEQKTILIVDDTRSSRLLFKDILNPLGFRILTAVDGKKGLQLALSHKPDLILTDLFMPLKSGLTMVKEVRQIPNFHQIPIIAVSASSLDEVIEKQSQAAGCNSFVTKPIDYQLLLNALGKHLNIEWIYKPL